MAFDYASLISAGLNFAGNAITNQINAERASSDMATYLNLVKKQRDWQNEDKAWSERYSKNLMDYQYDNFSSPSAQIHAYRKAGINPFLASQGGDVGSGQSVSPSAAPQSQRGSVSPFFRPELGNVMLGTADKLFNASTLKSQRIAALAEFSKSLPDLVKSVGRDGAKRIAGAFLGDDIDIGRIDKLADLEVARQSIAKRREDLALQISQEYDKAKADVILTNLSLEGHKINAEANELYKRGKLHDAEINELITRSAKNIAEKSHLNADTETINQLREHVVKSAEMQADLDYYDRQEGAALFTQGTKARNWQISQYGQDEALEQQVVENNRAAGLINRIVRGNEKRSKRIR